jgi:transposase InsO family protein
MAPDYPKKTVCAVLAFSRSTFYHRPQPPNDEALKEVIREVAGQFPTYGYRRVTVELERRQVNANRKRVARLMREMGLAAKIKRQTRRTTNSDHDLPRYANWVQDLSISRPDQVWVADITYVRLKRDFVYLAVIMDVFTRSIRGWHLGRGLDQELTLTALQKALVEHRPEIHHSDQGLQYAAWIYTQLLQQHGAKISMAEVGQPTQNGYAERLMRTIKEEEVDLSDYEDYHDAYRQIGQFLEDVYMHKRVHSRLGYLTPAEFESQWLLASAPAIEVAFT